MVAGSDGLGVMGSGSWVGDHWVIGRVIGRGRYVGVMGRGDG